MQPLEKTRSTPVIKAPNGKEYSAKIDLILEGQRKYYRSGITRSADFRMKQLRKLKDLIETNEETINRAIQDDLGRSDSNVVFTTGAVIAEINYALEIVFQLKPPFVSRRMKHWMRSIKGRSPPMFFGNKVYVEPIPKGVVLIIGPWNYPFLLTIAPLVGAIAAGNCAVIKPSEISPHSTSMISKLINDNFDSNYIHVTEGGVEESKILTSSKEWDHIFFTGGTEIGRKVYQAAAKNLIPVTLELGGKTPTIVDKNIHLKNTAKRIVQMKFMNAGQTCMAPDYLFVHKEIKDDLIVEMKYYIKKFYGDDIKSSTNYARVINEDHYNRLKSLLGNGGTVITGGDMEAGDNYIGPTILDDIKIDSEIMKEEIFGPILPMISWDDEDEIIEYIESQPHPLALYIYSNDKKLRNKILANTNFGGGMINDSVLYYLHPEVPFGGIGDSGFGSYLGKYSFDTFTQMRPIVVAGGLYDRFLEKIGMKFFRYPPGSKVKTTLLKIFHRKLSRFRI